MIGVFLGPGGVTLENAIRAKKQTDLVKVIQHPRG